MMKLHGKWCRLLALVLLTTFGSLGLKGQLTTVQAAQTQAAASFTVAPQLPADNVKQADYFNFKVTPGQKRVLVLVVTNNSQRTKTFDITPRVASTNTNGILDYGTNNTNPKLPAQISQLVSPAKTKSIKVLGKHTVKVPYNFTAPAKKFDGVMLGGFTIAEHHATKRAQSTTKKATGVVANVQYVIGLEFYNELKPSYTAPAVKIYRAGYRLAQARPTVTLGMANQTPGLVGKGKLSLNLYNAKQKKLMHFTKDQLTFAPQSRFKLHLDLKNKQLAAGHYTLSGKLTAKGGYSWNIHRSFTVTTEQANHVKKHAANFKPGKSWQDYLMYTITGLAVLVLIYEFYKWLKKRLNKSNQG